MGFDYHVLPIPDFGLRCRTCGYPLAGLPRHLCPECGKTILLEEFIPPGDYPVLIVDGKIVKATEAIDELLRRYEIPALYEQTRMEVMLGPIEHGRGLGKLCVPRDRYFETIDLLRRAALGEAMPPEPGRAGDPETEWSCNGCGEANPASFDLCWNCQRERGK
jgi:hypothetical protein